MVRGRRMAELFYCCRIIYFSCNFHFTVSGIKLSLCLAVYKCDKELPNEIILLPVFNGDFIYNPILCSKKSAFNKINIRSFYGQHTWKNHQNG